MRETTSEVGGWGGFHVLSRTSVGLKGEDVWAGAGGEVKGGHARKSGDMKLSGEFNGRTGRKSVLEACAMPLRLVGVLWTSESL